MALGTVGLATHIWNNNFRSVLLLAAFPLLLLGITWSFFYLLGYAGAHGWEDCRELLLSPLHCRYGRIIDPVAYANYGLMTYGGWALGAAALWLLGAFFFHQRMIDYATGARPVGRIEEPELYNLLENLCISRGLAVPALRVIDTDARNAYASGISDNTYTVTVTRGLLETLDAREMETVLAHELTHIVNRDVRLLIIATVFVGMISFLARASLRSMRYGGRRYSSRRGGGKGGGVILLAMALVLAVGYLFALLARFALSRSREYLADAGAVELTRNPGALASALKKISLHPQLKDTSSNVRQMCIENPPAAFSLFATHPPLASRLEALAMMGAAEYAPGAPMKAPGVRPLHPYDKARARRLAKERVKQRKKERKTGWLSHRRESPWG